jgi:hydrogenase expression/formation protein HypC
VSRRARSVNAMCVAVPMELIRIDGKLGVVRQNGVELTVSLDLLDGVAVGDYVVIHAGFAIQHMPKEEAQEALAIFERFA